MSGKALEHCIQIGAVAPEVMRYGRLFDFYAVYKYLRDKNKFSSFRTKAEEELLGKRPIGKKKTRQFEADVKLVKAVIFGGTY
jgi:hypothetical protein